MSRARVWPKIYKVYLHKICSAFLFKTFNDFSQWNAQVRKEQIDYLYSLHLWGYLGKSLFFGTLFEPGCVFQLHSHVHFPRGTHENVAI